VLGEEGPIQISGGPVSVAGDGTVTAAGAPVGRIRLVEFAPGTALQQEGNTYLAAPSGAARGAVESSLRQGFLESSNLNPVAGAVGMVVLQRQAEALQRALSIFHTEFNRTAAEELPRV
jgi:flagellar basal-body rod protein FlgF/flagellar basal-body rod protein FlgG